MVPFKVAETSRELLFDSEFLRQLERLELLAKKVFRGLLRGEHSAHRRGRGLEFSDFRRYRPGDDVRHIDWNIFSRLDRLFLKLYAAEEDMTLHILLDTSASMGFGQPLKFDYGRRVAAALAYIGLNNLDRVGISAFADGLGASLPPLKSKQQMGTVLGFLAELRCGEATRLQAAMREFAVGSRHPGLVIVIADLLGHEVQSGLDALRHRGHDVVVMQLLADDEIEPPLEGALRLLDAEDGDELKVTVDAELRRRYQARLLAYLGAIETYCGKRGIEYLRASTAIPFEDVIIKYLRQGAYLR